jgi:hypothetical protein
MHDGGGMRNGACPKCKSTKIYDGSGVPYKKGAYAQYAIKVSFASAAALDYYVCVDCGYVEGYVSSRAKLERIAAEWPRVRPGA